MSRTDIEIVRNLPPATPESQPQGSDGRPVPVEGTRVPGDRQKDWNPTVWSLLCLIAGTVLLIFSFFPIVFSRMPEFVSLSAPPFLACFVLSIIALVKRRVAGGIVMMILVFTVPPICMLADLAIVLPKAIQNVMDEKNGALLRLAFEDVSQCRHGPYICVKGWVRNHRTTAVNFVKVEVNWLDKQGTTLASGQTYVVGLEKMQPGVAKSFEITTLANPKIAEYSYRIALD